MAVIAVENVTVRFGGVTALDDVSLELGPNEILTLRKIRTTT